MSGNARLYTIELRGGPADGQVFQVPELPSGWLVPIFAAQPYFVADPETLYGVSQDTVLYTPEINRVTGENLVVDGRHIYRHGKRPDPPHGLPHSVVDQHPNATDWLPLDVPDPGPRYKARAWRGMELLVVGPSHLIVVAGTRLADGATTYCSVRETVERANEFGQDVVIEHLVHRCWHRCLDRLTPPCVAPGCDRPGHVVFQVIHPGRFAGRDWSGDQELHLCLPHGRDTLRAQAQQYHELPEWLRVDAAPPPSEHDHFASKYRYESLGVRGFGCILPMTRRVD